jgi:hypothetical protein
MADVQDKNHLAGRLLNEGEKTAAFFRSLSSEQLEQQIYTDGSCWQVRQILAHFVAAEASMTRLVENILAGGAGTPEDFNLDAYNERKVSALREVPVEDLLREFAERRAATANMAARLSPEDLARTGRHPFLGIVPVQEILKMFYLHNQIHLREIRKTFSQA